MNAPRKPEWFYRYSPRNGGDLVQASLELREEILVRWEAQTPKAQIAMELKTSIGLVRKVVRNARLAQDPRGFAKSKPLLSMGSSHSSVLDLYQEQWVIRGLAQRLDVHFTKIEQALRELAREVTAKT